MADRPEINEATRIESHEEAHRVADFGDLSQLGRSAERNTASGDQFVGAVDKIVGDFAHRFTDLADKAAHTSEFQSLVQTIHDMAEKGEPLYVLLRNALKH